MNSIEATHYEVLDVTRHATAIEIEAAYRVIVQNNHPDKTQHMGPFARSQANKHFRRATIACKVLSNLEERQKYDATLPTVDEFSGLESESTAKQLRITDYAPSDESPDGDSSPGASEQAEYRYKSTSNGTLIDIAISTWRLQLHISSKFHFTNDLSELSNLEDGPECVCFDIGLQRDITSNEMVAPTINEITIKVLSIPNNLSISKVKTLFRCLGVNNASLTLTLVAVPSTPPSPSLPWQLGFDFDMKDYLESHNPNNATCLIFSVDEPSEASSSEEGLDSPEVALKCDKQLNVDAWGELGSDRLMKMKYGSVEMWQLAAVGYNSSSSRRY